MGSAILIAGTASGAGKSFLTTALLRLAVRRGIKASPFKAQNMSLNSFVASDGGEIGIAQAIQALSAKIAPSIHHNPILLKSERERGLQVIVRGRFYKLVKPKEYWKEREVLWKYAELSLERLLSEFELVIMEGAGSPAEVNLLHGDLANIRPVLHSKAKVFLVGDIDRGGAFASLFGTYTLLKVLLPEFASLIRGYLINRFRGEKELLLPGLEKLKALSGLSCLGILPYFEGFALPEEDSLFLPVKQSLFAQQESAQKLRVRALRFPTLSMAFDLDPLMLEPDVDFRFSSEPRDVAEADLIVLPGTKQTVRDLLWLKEKGLDEALKRAIKNGAFVFGICGGYQCLGERIFDPERVESDLPEIVGLALLPCETIFEQEKITSEVSAELLSGNLKDVLWGFEIHKGQTKGELNLFKVRRILSDECMVEGSKQGNVFGTYVHGIFTNDGFRRYLLNLVREKRGLSSITNTYSYWSFVNQAIDQLANLVERHVDVDKIFEEAKQKP